jgi:porphobilinogen synthase
MNMTSRLRRLRRTAAIRGMVRETTLAPDDFILPLFVAGGGDVNQPLGAIPGAMLLGGRPLVDEAMRIAEAGIPAVLLFGMPEPSAKDERATAAFRPDGVTPSAVRLLRRAVPGLVIVTDVCLCEYTSHGHCGLIENGEIDNDSTLDCLCKIVLAHAAAGADAVAPSGMMDGMVRVMREVLDDAGHEQVMTMPYSAKFASRFYGPFKTATHSMPGESKHGTHQLDVGNARQALEEMRRDVDEGADMLIVKPALTSLDIIARARAELATHIAAYDVSGTYGMIHRAAAHDPAELTRMMMEVLTCIRRAGADLIITYFARQAAETLGKSRWP